jgi:hypothetical protein
MHVHGSRYKVIVLLSILLSITGALTMFGENIGSDAALRSRAAAALIMAPPFVGGAALFLASLGRFKAKMRLAYTLFALGIILFGLAMIQLPIIGLNDLWESWWANSGPVVFPFIFATLLIYAGMQKFALLLGIRSKLTNWWILLGSAVSFTILSFFAGRYFALYIDSVEGLDVYIAIVAWSVICITFAALLARQVIDRIGPFYQSGMRWLATALLVITFAGWHEYIISYITNNDTWYVAYGAALWPFIVGGLVILRAGYAFTLLGSTLPYIPVHEAPAVAPDPEMKYAESLASLAALASSQTHEVVKEAQAVAAAPSPQTVVQSYNKLENYLMNQDPLREFKKEEIRGQLTPEFRALIENQRKLT